MIATGETNLMPGWVKTLAEAIGLYNLCILFDYLPLSPVWTAHFQVTQSIFEMVSWQNSYEFELCYRQIADVHIDLKYFWGTFYYRYDTLCFDKSVNYVTIAAGSALHIKQQLVYVFIAVHAQLDFGLSSLRNAYTSDHHKLKWDIKQTWKRLFFAQQQ